MEDLLRCPISKKIFLDPVTIGDGFVYERTAIETWFKTNIFSPTTKKFIIETSFVSCNIIKQLVSIYLENNPDKCLEQFSL